MTAKYVYIGTGEFYNGIPARDLTDEDWAGLTDKQKETVAKSPLYKAAKKAAAKKDGE